MLQNCLSAATQVSKRFAETSDLELMQKCFTEMRSSIDKVSASLTKLADHESHSDPSLSEPLLNGFIHEAFQLASFVLRRLGFQVQFEIRPNIIGSVSMDVMQTQLALIAWMRDACDAVEFREEPDRRVVFIAEPCEADIAVWARKGARERTIRIRSLIENS